MQPIRRWTTCFAVAALCLMAVACTTSDTDPLSGAAVEQQEAVDQTLTSPDASAEEAGAAAAVPGTTAETCCQFYRFRAGNVDQFVTTDGVEPVAPSQGLLKRLAAMGKVSKNFDDPKTDSYFGHTFQLPVDGCVKSAGLRISVRPEGSATNDSILLSFTNPDGTWNAAEEAWAYFGSGNANSTGLWSAPWQSPLMGSTERVINFQTPHAAVTGQGKSTLLNSLKAHRSVDVIIQDDTNVNYLELTVELCACPPDAGPIDDSVATPEN